MIDLRSDTVTRPSAAMRRAMADAEVGDDGYGEDPTVRRLEERFAVLVGKEAAVYVPSGTMGNQIALRLLGQPGTSVAIGRRQHPVIYEAGAAAVNGSAQLYLLDDEDGTLDPNSLRELVDASKHHWLPVSAVQSGVCFIAVFTTPVRGLTNGRLVAIHPVVLTANSTIA